MESPGTVEPKTFSDSYHQGVQKKQWPREVQGLTQGHKQGEVQLGFKLRFLSSLVRGRRGRS